jgi:hypothetical protein
MVEVSMSTRPYDLQEGLVTASLRDTFAVFVEVMMPTLAKGVIIRRPKVVGLAEKLGLDTRAVKRLQSLRAKYGPGPILLPVPGRRQSVILSPDHVHRVLAGAPEPFAPATAEKRSALAHFEPRVSLISTPPERNDRGLFNEELLESRCPVHSMAEPFMSVVSGEVEALLSRPGHELSWNAFTVAWHRIVRRMILGEKAREDDELTDMLARLRSAANWGFLHPGRKALYKQFHERLNGYLACADEGSLAARIAALPKMEATAPAHQVAHYLFAFDAGGMATFRTLALLATHPRECTKVRKEIQAAGVSGRKNLPFLRACIFDCLRLWPTTPVILRETTREVEWDGGIMPANTHVLIYAPYFHRDDESLEYAHRFAPELWLEEEPGRSWPLIPFSGGPGICPARHLVPMMGSAIIAALLSSREIELRHPNLDPNKPLPGTLDNYRMSFTLRPRHG